MMKLDEFMKIFKDKFFLFYAFLFTIVFFIIIFLLFDSLSNKHNDFEYDKYANIEIPLNSSQKGIIEDKKNIENIYTDVDKLENQKEKYDKIIQDLKEKIKQKDLELSKNNIDVKIEFRPYYFENEILTNTWIISIKEVVYWNFLNGKNINFTLELNQEKTNIRWKFISNTIKLFGVERLSETELVSVFIHELWHYFDIVFLDKKVLFDLSDKFYEISWSWVNILREWSLKNDFVSGYGMTNKYEDFAESFVYYILFNDDFRQKASLNVILQQKYDFFWKYIFRNDEFKKTNFRNIELLDEFHRDITKINFSLQNFLEYLKNWL